MEAFIKPDTTLKCIDELLMTTFVNAMDPTSLAFMMPLLLRGLKDPNYELVKKAAVSAGNTAALVSSPSDIAPFVPLFEPLHSKLEDHSSPEVRQGETAKEKLLEGSGEPRRASARARRRLISPPSRPRSPACPRRRHLPVRTAASCSSRSSAAR